MRPADPTWALLVNAHLSKARPLVETFVRLWPRDYALEDYVFIEGHKGWSAFFCLRGEKADRDLAAFVVDSYPFACKSREQIDLLDKVFAGRCPGDLFLRDWRREEVKLVEWTEDGNERVLAWDDGWALERTDATAFVESLGIPLPSWDFPKPDSGRPARAVAVYDGATIESFAQCNRR